MFALTSEVWADVNAFKRDAASGKPSIRRRRWHFSAANFRPKITSSRNPSRGVRRCDVPEPREQTRMQKDRDRGLPATTEPSAALLTSDGQPLISCVTGSGPLDQQVPSTASLIGIEFGGADNEEVSGTVSRHPP